MTVTDRQQSIARMAVALLLASVHHKAELNVAVVMEAFDLAGVGLRDASPLCGVTEQELAELLETPGPRPASDDGSDWLPSVDGQ
jgi:hypothetical protein